MTRIAGGPLEGIRVIELTHAIAGPHTGQILADHGADVIKVEPPGGELARFAYPSIDDESVYFASHNRGKRSVELDLKSEVARTALRRLAETADVLVTNYADGVPARLGFGHVELREANPRLVYAHITGFGVNADWAPPRAFDGVIQAMSGIADLTGPAEGGPTFTGLFPADHLAANQTVIAILMALHERQRTGRGAFLPISMLDTYQSILGHEVGMAREGVPMRRHGNSIPGSFGDVFETADGAAFISPIAQPAWERFWEALGRPSRAFEISYEESVGEPYEALHAEVSAWTRARTTEEVTKTMSAAGIPNGPVLTVTEAADHMASPDRRRLMRVRAPGGREFDVAMSPIPVARAEDALARAVPAIGEHTREVLAEVLGPEELAALDGE